MRVSIQVFTHATPLELQWQVKKLTRLSNRNQLQHYLTVNPRWYMTSMIFHMGSIDFFASEKKLNELSTLSKCDFCVSLSILTETMTNNIFVADLHKSEIPRPGGLT